MTGICQPWEKDKHLHRPRLLQAFLYCGTVGVVQPVAAVFHPWVLWTWFIRGRVLWAAISPFPSVLWLPDNIQLSLMCHQRPMVCLSALLQCSLKRKHRNTWWHVCFQTCKITKWNTSFLVWFCYGMSSKIMYKSKIVTDTDYPWISHGYGAKFKNTL